MNENFKVRYPKEFLEFMQVEETIFSPMNGDVGIATMSYVDGTSHVLQIYQLLLNEEIETFEVAQQLTAFSFPSRKDLIDFQKRLPHLNGIEMLFLLNPLENKDSVWN